MVLSHLKEFLYGWFGFRIRNYFLKKGIYDFPVMNEIRHYAACQACVQEIERQGWRVEFQHKDKKIYEVTFRDAQYYEQLKERNRRDRLYV